MITVRRDRNILIFEKTDDVRFSHCVSFYTIQEMTGDYKRNKYCANLPGTNWCGPVEKIFEMIAEPYRTALIFNIDLLEEIFKEG